MITVTSRIPTVGISATDAAMWVMRRDRYARGDPRYKFWSLLWHNSMWAGANDAELMFALTSDSHDAPKKESATYRDY